MRNISFFLTTEQFHDRTKTVTRRVGWEKLQPGTELMGCVKCQGLKPGELMERLGVIEVVSVIREPLDRMAWDHEYGQAEAIKEGFPRLTGAQFVAMFCQEMRVKSEDLVTRIEFRYVDREVSHGKKF